MKLGHSRGQIEGRSNSQKTHRIGRRRYQEHLWIIKICSTLTTFTTILVTSFIHEIIKYSFRQVTLSNTGFNMSCSNVPMLVSPVCPEDGNVLAAPTGAAVTATADTASAAERCPVWGLASSCWASSNA